MTDPSSSKLLARYANARLPRYASYPTAPNFSASDRGGDRYSRAV